MPQKCDVGTESGSFPLETAMRPPAGQGTVDPVLSLIRVLARSAARDGIASILNISADSCAAADATPLP